MNKLVKGLLIGGAVGATAMAVRAYQRDDETDTMREDMLRGAAVGAAAGVALGLLTESKPVVNKVSVTVKKAATEMKKPDSKARKMASSAQRIYDVQKKARKKAAQSRSKWSLLHMGQMFAALTPLVGSMAEIWQARMQTMAKNKKKAGKQSTRASKNRKAPESVIIPGPLGRVRLSTMHMGSAFSDRAGRMRTRVRKTRGGRTHNGSH